MMSKLKQITSCVDLDNLYIILLSFFSFYSFCKYFSFVLLQVFLRCLDLVVQLIYLIYTNLYPYSQSKANIIYILFSFLLLNPQVQVHAIARNKAVTSHIFFLSVEQSGSILDFFVFGNSICDAKISQVQSLPIVNLFV